MKKTKLIAIILVISVIAIVIATFFALCLIGFDFDEMKPIENTEATYDIVENFNRIKIYAQNSDIKVLPSSNGECRVVIEERKGFKYDVGADGYEFHLHEMDMRKWYEKLEINPEKRSVTVYVPDREYIIFSIDSRMGNINVSGGIKIVDAAIFANVGNINFSSGIVSSLIIHTINEGSITVSDSEVRALSAQCGKSGNVNISNLTIKEDMTLYAGYGNINASDVVCNEANVDTYMGSIMLDNVIAGEKMEVEAEEGSVTFNMCNAAEIVIEVLEGNVNGTLLSSKRFMASSENGNVSVPTSDENGGKCEIKVGTGNIIIEIS
jgi:hypothetical protein